MMRSLCPPGACPEAPGPMLTTSPEPRLGGPGVSPEEGSVVSPGGGPGSSRGARPRARPGGLPGALLRGGTAGVVLALLLHGGYVLVGPNFHTVIPGAIYRCGQPSGRQLKRLVRKLGIRTVVNLRGVCEDA